MEKRGFFKPLYTYAKRYASWGINSTNPFLNLPTENLTGKNINLSLLDFSNRVQKLLTAIQKQLLVKLHTALGHPKPQSR
jgi:hypothetical protein